MTNRRYAAVLAIVLGLGLAGMAYGQEAKEVEHPGERHGQQRGRWGLGLTSEQQEKMDELRVAHLKEVMPVQTDIRIKQMELAALWRADELDAKKLVAKVKEISNLRAKLELAKVNHRIAMHNVLTPEQRAKAGRFLGGKGRRGMRGLGRRRMMGPGRFGPRRWGESEPMQPPPPDE